MFQINWTISAARQRVKIVEFWNEHNKSDLYSKKILKETSRIEKMLLLNQYLGIRTNFEGIWRVLVLKNFSLYYIVRKESLEVVGFRDNRRDPNTLDLKK